MNTVKRSGLYRRTYDRSLVADIARTVQSYRYARCSHESEFRTVDGVLDAIADEMAEHDPTFDRHHFMRLAHYRVGRSIQQEEEP